MSRGTIPDLEPTHPGSLMSTSQVAEYVGVPRSTVARWARNKVLPRPQDVTPASPIWRRSAIEKFDAKRREELREREAAREAARDAAAA